MIELQRGTRAGAGVHALSRRRLLALPAVAAIASVAGPGMASPAIAGSPPLPPAVQARLIPAMREAIAEARLATWPFGAVLLDVDSGETVYRAHNVTTDGDPSAHAEIALLRGAGNAGIDLTRTVVVTSAESCPMCASCELWANVAGVAYGTSIPTLVRYGYSQILIRQREVVARAPFTQMFVAGRILTEETDPLYAAGPPA